MTILINNTGAISAIRMVKSTAYGGDGNSNLASSQFGLIDFNTTYSDAFSPNLSEVQAALPQSVPLNSTAMSDIVNNDVFICCFVTDGFLGDFTGVFASSDSALKSGMFFNVINNTPGFIPFLELEQDNGFFEGNIPYVHFNTVALTQTEIQNNFNALRKRFVQDTVN